MTHSLPFLCVFALGSSACCGSQAAPAGPPATPVTPAPATDSADAAPAVTPPSQAAIQLGEADFGAPDPSHARVGDRVVVELPANETTGFSWRFRWEPAAALAEVENQYHAEATGRVGSGGVHRLVLDVRAAGDVVLYAQYGRWWDGGERQPEKSLTLRVDVPGGD